MLLLNKNLIKMAKGLWGWIILISLLKIVVLIGGTEFAGVIAKFLGNLLTLDMSVSQAYQAILWAFIYACLMFLGDLLIGEAEYRCTAKARINLRQDIFSKVLDLDVGHIEKIGPTSAITTCVDGVESMQLYYSKYLPSLFYSVLAPIYLFFRLKSISLSIASFLLIVSLCIFPLNNTFRQYTEKLKKRYWSDMEDLTGYYLESVRGLVSLKLFNQDEKRKEVLTQKANKFCDSIMAMMKVNFLSFLVSDSVIYLSVFISTWMICHQYRLGKMDISDCLMILMMSFTFFSSLRQLMNATHSALAGVAASQKVEDVANIDVSRKESNKKHVLQAIEGFQIEDVTFSYDGKKEILKNINLTIPKGKTVALVGRSGSGKSTIASLLMYFNDVNRGNIYLNGKNIVDYATKDLRKEVIMVPQSVGMFSGTIADNLKIAKQDATDEELLEVLDEVRLKDKVLSFEKGLDSDVGDAGARLSGGERQRIGIARALLSGAQYIIFDEATSSVDVESENEIWQCIHRLAKSKTLIIISHRLSTIQNADCIYVLNQGTIQEQGNHQDLMKQDGLYHQLVLEQDQLEKQGEQMRGENHE